MTTVFNYLFNAFIMIGGMAILAGKPRWLWFAVKTAIPVIFFICVCQMFLIITSDGF